MFKFLEIMKSAHQSASNIMQSPGWSRHGYRYCFQYALQGEWDRARLSALTASEQRIVAINSELASLEYLSLAQNIAPRRAALFQIGVVNHGKH